MDCMRDLFLQTPDTEKGNAMSIKEIKPLFERTSSCQDWSLCLVQIKESDEEKAIYVRRKLEIKPDGSLTELVQEIRKKYLQGSRPLLASFEAVENYDGVGLPGIIYRLHIDNPLIEKQYRKMCKAFSDSENNFQDFLPGASMIEGTIDGKSLWLFSMKSPFTVLKHKYRWSNAGTYEKYTEPVLTLRTLLDVIIYDDTIYLLTPEGEKLFLLEQAYKASAPKKAKEIAMTGIVSDGEAFARFAVKGFNPRRLISLNQNKLRELQNSSKRREMSNKFSIPLVDDKIDTSTQEATDKLIKLLCNKGMVDPFDGNAMEVAGAKRWK